MLTIVLALLGAICACEGWSPGSICKLEPSVGIEALVVRLSDSERFRLADKYLPTIDPEVILARDLLPRATWQADIDRSISLHALRQRQYGTWLPELALAMGHPTSDDMASCAAFLPSWVRIRLGFDERERALWNFQVDSAFGWPFRSLACSVMGASVSRQKPYFLGSIEGGFTSFDFRRKWVADAYGTSPAGWQQWALPWKPVPAGLLGDVALWGACSWIAARGIRAMRRKWLADRGRCGECGQTLAGERACPECGARQRSHEVQNTL